MNARRSTARLLALAALSAAPACAPAADARGTLAQPVQRARDVRGEPLALLPPQPLLALRVDTASARRSPHWPALYDLARRNAPDFFSTLERELGFDLFAQTEAAALAVYARPGGPFGASAEVGGWPLLYARGGLDRDAILAAARARTPSDDPLQQRRVDGVLLYTTRSRSYLFPAPGVVLIFDPALTRRVLRQLSGEERGSAEHDARFTSLWAQAGGTAGLLRVAGDAAGLRRNGMAGAYEDAAALDAFVARVDGSGDLELRAAGLARDEASAQQIAAQVDDVRQQLLGRLELRLLGLSRLLNQGVTAVSEGRVIRVGVEARAGELSRLLGAAQFFAPSR